MGRVREKLWDGYDDAHWIYDGSPYNEEDLRDRFTLSLRIAAKRGDAEKCRRELARGADAHDTDEFGSTPLHLAAAANLDNSAATVRVLLAAGADPNVRDHEGRTPLHLIGDKCEVVRALIDGGAVVDAEDDKGLTALHHAALHGNASACKAMIEAEISVDVLSPRGRTPLHFAAMAGAVGVVKYLCEIGANTLSEDAEGLRPGDVIGTATCHIDHKAAGAVAFFLDAFGPPPPDIDDHGDDDPSHVAMAIQTRAVDQGAASAL